MEENEDIRGTLSADTTGRYAYRDKDDRTHRFINGDSNQVVALAEVPMHEFTTEATEILTDEIRRLSDVEKVGDKWTRTSATWSTLSSREKLICRVWTG